MPSDAVVHVVDDDEAVRESLAFLLRAAQIEVKTYDSAVTFLRNPPAGGCVVTDVRMPKVSGIDMLQRLRELGLTLPVIVITGHGDVPLAVEAMKAGAFDFLEKPFDDERLLSLVSRAMERVSGQTLSDEQIAIRTRIARLSQRERQVLKGLVDGQLNKTIAWELGISARTVEVYRAKLMAKMEAGAFAELVRMALLAGDLET